MEKKFSLVIINCHSQKRLEKVLGAVAKEMVLPEDVVIVNFESISELSEHYDFPIKLVNMKPLYNGNSNIAKARNTGVKHAQNENIIFLDSDCIPMESFTMRFTSYFDYYGSLLMATPLKLNDDDTEGDLERLQHSESYKAVPKADGCRKISDYSKFKGWCFCISKTTWKELGGFDESFSGLGFDTLDFAQKAKKAKIDFYVCDAIVFHREEEIQYLAKSNIEIAVKDWNKFYQKWRVWTQKPQLESLIEKGKITWEIVDSEIRLV